MIRPPTRSTLFPYTTLFRSNLSREPFRPSFGRLVFARGRGRPANRCRLEEPNEMSIRSMVLIVPLSLGLSTRVRSEEHTSELQSHVNLVCRLLLEKKRIIDA